MLKAIGSWLSSVGADIGGKFLGMIEMGVRSISFSLCSFIYKLIIDLYTVFYSLCTARLLSMDLIEAISTRVGLILGLVMLFNVILSFVKMLIDPDSFSDAKTGAVSVIKKVILVIVLLGVSNFIFDALYYAQNAVVTNNIISKLLLPVKVVDENGNELEEFGGLLAEESLHAFYHLTEVNEGDDFSGSNEEKTFGYCQAVENSFRTQIVEEHLFTFVRICLNESFSYPTPDNISGEVNNGEEFVMNFNWLLAPLVGIGICYFLLVYCINVGVRMIQLLVLEIAAPAAIVSYLAPKGETFNKWLKMYISTYIDVFIRIAIINLVVLLISALFSSSSGFEGFKFWEQFNVNLGTRYFIIVVMVLALLSFAKKAPELLKELLPKGASNLGFGDNSLGGGFFGGLVGGTLGGALSAIKNEKGIGNKAIGFLQGGLGGALHGGVAGLKDNKGGLSGLRVGGKSGSAASAATAQRIRLGGSRFVTPLAGNYASRIDDENEKLQKTVDMYNTAQDEAKSEAQKNGQNYYINSATYGSRVNMRQLDALRNDQRISAETRAKYAEEYERLEKAATMFNLDVGAAAENGEISFTADGQFAAASYRDSSGAIQSVNRDDMAGMSAHILGSENAKIEENIRSVSGQSRGTVGRGNVAKTKRNTSSSQIVRNTSSDKYQRSKANQKKN